MLDLERPITTDLGNSVRIICTDAKGIRPIIGLVTFGEIENIIRSSLDGSDTWMVANTNRKLINPVIKRWRWAYSWGPLPYNSTTSDPKTEVEIQEFCKKNGHIILGRIEGTESPC